MSSTKVGYLIIVFTLFLAGSLFGQVEIIDPHISTPESDSTVAKIQRVSPDQFARGCFFNPSGDSIQYRLLVPEATNHTGKFPLIVVFHGSGGIGTDNVTQLGLFSKMWALPEMRKKYPAYVLVPQFSTRSSNYSPDPIRNVRSSGPGPQLFVLFDKVEDLVNAYPIDKDKIYVMGYSMGASTVLNSLGTRPDLFRGGICFAGVPQFSHVDILKNKPIWFIHGNADNTNAIEPAKLLFNELSQNKKVRFTELKNADHHNIPPVTLILNEIPEWLFTH